MMNATPPCKGNKQMNYYQHLTGESPTTDLRTLIQEYTRLSARTKWKSSLGIYAPVNIKFEDRIANMDAMTYRALITSPTKNARTLGVNYHEAPNQLILELGATYYVEGAMFWLTGTPGTNLDDTLWLIKHANAECASLVIHRVLPLPTTLA